MMQVLIIVAVWAVPLAAVDWSIVLSTVSLIATVAVAFILHNLSTRTRRMEDLEAKVTSAAEMAIDAKLGQIRAEIETSVRVLQAVVAALQKRLDLGEGWFEDLRNHDHRQELGVVEKIAELRQEFVELRAEVRERLGGP